MPVLPSFHRRWPELGLVAVLLLVAVLSGAALRSLATVVLGGVLLFSLRRRVRDVGVGLALLAVLLLATLAVTFTIDLGAVFGGVIKHVAEQQGSRYLERPLHIGRLGIRLLRGQFVVEDVRIEGLHPGDEPFFSAQRVLVDFPWYRVARTREFFVRSIEMNDWTMQIEKFETGDNLPRLTRQSKEPPGPKRFTTTLDYVHAYRGRFTYIDHGTWQTIARNLDIYVRHTTGEYFGTATITDGMVQIKDSLPMRSDMRVTFKVESTGLVRLPRIVLDTDGAHSLVTGQVDFGHWPEMVYQVDSKVDLWRMREVFFAHESWRSRGEATFKGTFRLFKGGHELKGDFTSALAHVNALAFPDLKGSLIWVPHRFEVTHATAGFYEGEARFQVLDRPALGPAAGRGPLGGLVRTRQSRPAIERRGPARPAAARDGQRPERARVAARPVRGARRRGRHQRGGATRAGRARAGAEPLGRRRLRRAARDRAGAGRQPLSAPHAGGRRVQLPVRA